MEASFGSVVRVTLRRAATWTRSPQERSAFFAERLAEADEQVRALAHLEVARAPCSEIRKYGNALPRKTIHAFSGEIRYLEWHALYILLLALSRHPHDTTKIRDALENAARFGSGQNLAAWATALVEVDREEGIGFLKKNYLGNTRRSKNEIRAIITALSTHGNAVGDRLRDRIVKAYAVALEGHPELAQLLVNDLAAWHRFDLGEGVAKALLASPGDFDLSSLLTLRAYPRKQRKGS